MRHDAPATPQFTADVEARLRREAHGRRRRILPFHPGALRAVREVSRTTVHATMAAGLAAAVLLSFPTATETEPPPLGPDLSASLAPAYLHQYGAEDIDQTIAVARDRGYEVQLVTWYVPDQTMPREVISMVHAGERVDRVPDADRPRGPLLIVVGLAVGDRSSTAN